MSFAITFALLAAAALGGAPHVDVCPASGAPSLAALSEARPARPVLLGLLAADALSPAAGGTFTKGAEAVAQALALAEGQWRWSVVRSGLSADGRHGFTAGYIDETAADGKTAGFKFLAYWVKDGETWRIKAFRKSPAPQGERTSPAPCLRSRAAVPGPAEHQRTGLMAAEQKFSDDAQVLGIGPAFAKHGSASSINLGQGAGLTLGAVAIGAEIGSGNQPPLAWSSDDALVAPGGDLGLSWGVIRVLGKEEEAKGRFAFFTVWHRAGPGEPWRYIAE
ncbi:MAG TPA: hypothetical protein VIG90_12720 [Pedomonas sp.]|uniref:hypothetical protein n=1 Tax=Pedomonas sp. TaxID=2976421 RepID=UPI002F418A24